MPFGDPYERAAVLFLSPGLSVAASRACTCTDGGCLNCSRLEPVKFEVRLEAERPYYVTVFDLPPARSRPFHQRLNRKSWEPRQGSS